MGPLVESPAMHRFFLPPERCAEALLKLDGREAHHASQVLRLKRGATVVVLDGAGSELQCLVETVSRNELSLSVQAKKSAPLPPNAITLFQAVPKGKIMESIIQKSVELGVRQIVPLLTERVVTHLDDEGAENRREKWQQVAIEAIKQCGALWLPEIAAPTGLQEYLESRTENFDLALVGSLQTERHHPREYFNRFRSAHDRPPRAVAVWIGPEGDFSADELKSIQDAGALPVTLGELVLRVETAAVYCLSILNYELTA